MKNLENSKLKPNPRKIAFQQGIRHCFDADIYLFVVKLNSSLLVVSGFALLAALLLMGITAAVITLKCHVKRNENFKNATNSCSIQKGSGLECLPGDQGAKTEAVC